MKRPIAAGLFASLTALAGAHSRAEPIDPSLATRIVVGRAGAPAPMARLDPARTAQSRVLLPTRAHVVWRTRVDGGIDHGIAVDRDGTIVVAHAATRLTSIDRAGVTLSSTRLGNGEPLAAPLITRDSTRVVATSAGIFGVSRAGQVRYRLVTDGPLSRSIPAPLAMDDGSVALASDRRLHWVERDGVLRASVTAPEPIAALLMGGEALMAVTDAGTVLEYLPWGALAVRGNLGGPLTGGCMLDGHNLVAIVADSRLMDLDLASGERLVRLDAGGSMFGPMALGDHGSVWVPVMESLRVIARDGRESRRYPVSLPPALGASSAVRPSAGRAGDGELVLDRRGTAMYAVSGSDVIVANASGMVSRVADSACDDVVGLVPAGDGRVILACSSGLVLAIADDAR